MKRMHNVFIAAGRVVVGILVIAVFWGCSTRKLLVAEMTDLMENGSAAMERDDDLVMLQQALPANIKLLEALLESDPQNERLLALLARLYGSYAFLFLDGRIEALQLNGERQTAVSSKITSLKERAVRYYGRGLDYALRAIEVRHPLAADRLQRVADSARFVQSLQAQDLSALFWYGFNLSGLINHERDAVATIARGHLVEKSMRRVLALQPQFHHGGAHLVLMVYYASRSPLMGGNLTRAREHYGHLKTMHGKDLLFTDLYYARYVLVQRQDRRQFEQMLTAITNNPDPDPRFRLFNRIAVDRALVYLTMADRLFEGS